MALHSTTAYRSLIPALTGVQQSASLNGEQSNFNRNYQVHLVLLHDKFYWFLIPLGLSFILCSCTLHRLEVQTQPITHEYLASDRIGTPDPLLQEPFLGQRLLIEWSFSEDEVEVGKTFLSLTIRFHNHQQEEISVPIIKKRGSYFYDLINESFVNKRGILTYHVEIRKKACVLAEWKHPLWVEWITLDVEQPVAAPVNR